MTRFTSKAPWLACLLVSIIFLSSCTKSFYASKYNRLDWVQKKSTVTAPDLAKEPSKNQDEDMAGLSSSSVQNPLEETPGAIENQLKKYQDVPQMSSPEKPSKFSSKIEKLVEKKMEHSVIAGKIAALQNSKSNQTDQSTGVSHAGFSNLDPDLRTGLLLIIVGLILSILWVLPEPVGWIFGTIGAIAIVIGLIFILLYLLES